MDWIGGGVWVGARLRGQVCSNGVLVDVGEVGSVVVGVDDAATVVTAFPHVEFALQEKGEVSFDVLHCFFEELGADARGPA